jgi:hypothetical protein
VTLSVTHDWNSITTDSQICGYHLIYKINSLIYKRNILGYMILGYMDKANQDISSQTSHSSNMVGLSTGKMEREIACILATKFHMEPTIDPILEVRLNPIMKDLIINRLAMKRKQRK